MYRFARFAPASTTAMLLALLATSPAFAQTMTPDEAWRQLERIADQLDLSITSTGQSATADAMIATGVRIFPEDDPNTVVVSMDSLRVAGADGQVSLTPSSTFDVAIAVSRNETRHVQITHDGRISGMLDSQNAALNLSFPSLRALLLPNVNAKGTPSGGPELDMTFGALEVTASAANEGSAALNLDAGQVTYDLTYPDPSGAAGAMISQDGSMTGLHLAFTGTEMDLLSDDDGMLAAAFAGGFNARLEMSAEGSRQTSTQMLEGMPLNMVTEGSSSSIQISAVDGRVDITGDAGPLSVSGSYGPIRGGATLGGMDMAFGLPLVVTPEEQEVRYRVSFRDLVPAPELLAMVGASQFAGDAVTVTVDLGAQARLLQELGEDFFEADAPPVDVSGASLNELRVAVGDSVLTGSGAVELIGGLMAQIGRPMPEANGDFSFDLVGGERLLTRLQSMGIIPQDQLFFVRMMLNGLSRPVGDDHLQSEVAIRPGGVVTVNGAPIPF